MKRIKTVSVILIFTLSMCVSAQALAKDQAEGIHIKDKNGYSDQWADEYVSGIEFKKCVTQEDIDRIATMENLRSLSIEVSENDIDLSPLVNLTQLQELRILFVAGTDDVDLTFVKEMRYLIKIHFMKCTALKDLSLFEDMTFLKVLFVGYVDDADLNYLAGCKSLESVNIKGGHIRNAEGLSELNHLHLLELLDTQPERDPKKEPAMQDLNQLSKLTGLERVELRFVHVEDISPLAQLPNLQWIRLVGTGVDDIESLNQLERLETLEIYGNGSKRVKEQEEKYFSDIERVYITEELPNALSNY